MEDSMYFLIPASHATNACVFSWKDENKQANDHDDNDPSTHNNQKNIFSTCWRWALGHIYSQATKNSKSDGFIGELLTTIYRGRQSRWRHLSGYKRHNTR